MTRYGLFAGATALFVDAMSGHVIVSLDLVSFRTRQSVGATAKQIHWLVPKDGCSWVVSGLATGLFIGLAGHTIVRLARLLFQRKPGRAARGNVNLACRSYF